MTGGPSGPDRPPQVSDLNRAEVADPDRGELAEFDHAGVADPDRGELAEFDHAGVADPDRGELTEFDHAEVIDLNRAEVADPNHALLTGRGPAPDGASTQGRTADSNSRAFDLDADGGTGASPFEPEQKDWAWVEEWRTGGEPVPWGPGLSIAAFTAFLVASAVYVLSSGLSARPLLAIAVNVVVVAGLCPALWLSRALPVLRWIAAGAAAGVLVAWVCVLVFLV